MDWQRHKQTECMNYIEVMSLRAWSSSSLIALYLSFWEYNSSFLGVGLGKGKGRGKDRGDGEVRRWVKHPFQQNDRPELKQTDTKHGKVEEKFRNKIINKKNEATSNSLNVTKNILKVNIQF